MEDNTGKRRYIYHISYGYIYHISYKEKKDNMRKKIYISYIIRIYIIYTYISYIIRIYISYIHTYIYETGSFAV